MWQRAIPMGVDEATFGLHAKDGPPVDPGGIVVPTTLYTMAPAATQGCAMDDSAFGGLQDAGNEDVDLTRLH
jgi:hypothetical protein